MWYISKGVWFLPCYTVCSRLASSLLLQIHTVDTSFFRPANQRVTRSRRGCFLLALLSESYEARRGMRRCTDLVGGFKMMIIALLLVVALLLNEAHHSYVRTRIIAVLCTFWYIRCVQVKNTANQQVYRYSYTSRNFCAGHPPHPTRSVQHQTTVHQSVNRYMVSGVCGTRVAAPVDQCSIFGRSSPLSLSSASFGYWGLGTFKKYHIRKNSDSYEFAVSPKFHHGREFHVFYLSTMRHVLLVRQLDSFHRASTANTSLPWLVPLP